jgi:(1->4)-alpha-D-glucan 1-alpha-D-glucosylmutase
MTNSTPKPAPSATYRIQLRQGMNFERAAGLLDYLSSLGVSHVYLSPIWQAGADSTHGYDVVDPNVVDASLGGEAGRRAFWDAAEKAGLGIILDIVPNHMSVASEHNRWWWDLLEQGRFSRFAAAFDVDWDGPSAAARDKVLLPILDERYGRALQGGKIKLLREGSRLFLSAVSRKLPLSAESIATLLAEPAQTTGSPELSQLVRLLQAFKVSGTVEASPGAVVERALAPLADGPALAAVDAHLAKINGDAEALDRLVLQQHYRLAHYHAARYDLDYRRFFDIAELAALSMDQLDVFEATHETLLQWVREGQLNAVRVDHPDGLRDPARYLQRLRSADPGLWIVVEKILGNAELLSDDWPVEGTTGYDFLNVVGGLFVEPSARPALEEAYANFLGQAEAPRIEDTIHESKRAVLDGILAADVRRLTRALQALLADRLEFRDFAYEELRLALTELLAGMPVYRTYVRPESPHRTADTRALAQAYAAARAARPDFDADLGEHLLRLLGGQAESAAEWDFALRFEQVSSATMAKGVEDTAFYRDARFLPLNEVGHDPSTFATSPEQFHAYATLLSERWPKTLVATTTHDTKRGEDARLRVAALSEFTSEWTQAAQRWSELARAGNESAPERNTEYLLWQTLVAAHPINEERLSAYLTKAMREAKLHTSWLTPNASYERRVLRFAKQALENAELMSDVDRFVKSILPVAWRSSLSQTLLKLTACGVPDLYQGSELWDTRLTDPDNRGPVDFESLAASLARATAAPIETAIAEFPSGLPKLWLTARVLGLRRLQPHWFGAEAPYRALPVKGREASRIVAFSRGSRVIVVAPRLYREVLERGYSDTSLELPEGWYRNLFESDLRLRGSVKMADLLGRFPVALLIAEGLD